MILDQDYRVNPGVSNSAIKDFINHGPKLYFDKYVDETRVSPAEWSTESTDIGDLVDCMSTTPHLFDTYYYVSSGVKGTKEFKDILHRARELAIEHVTGVLNLPHNQVDNHPILLKPEEAKPFLLKAAREADYQRKYLDETLANYMVTHGGAYYSDLSVAAGRKVIDMTTKMVADKTKESLFNSDTIGPILSQQSENGIEAIKQGMITIKTADGVFCKILVDHMLIDHDAKMIFPSDIKTSLSHQQFLISYYKFLYGNQGSFYSAVLQDKYSGYAIAPFRFIVGTTDSGEDPMIYKMSKSELDIYKNGAVLKSGRKIRGWRNVLDDIKWHTDQNLWRYPREYYNNGFMTLTSFADESIDSFDDGGIEIF